MLGTIEDPIFITNQICKALGIRNDQAWVIDIKKEFQGTSLPGGQNIPQYRGQNMSVITERGVIEIMSRSESKNAKKFRDFIYLLLKNLRLGKIQIVFNQVQQLTQEKLSLLHDKEELMEQVEEQKQEIQEKDETIDQIETDFQFLHESASQICQNERTKVPNKRSKDEFLVIVRLDDDKYKAHCVQRTKKDQILKEYPGDIVIVLKCVSAKQFWNSCHELLRQEDNRRISERIITFRLINFEEEDLIDFLEEQIDVLHQVPDND